MTNKPTQADIDKADGVALKLVPYTDTQGRVRNPIAATSLIAQAIADAKAEGKKDGLESAEKVARKAQKRAFIFCRKRGPSPSVCPRNAPCSSCANHGRL